MSAAFILWGAGVAVSSIIFYSKSCLFPKELTGAHLLISWLLRAMQPAVKAIDTLAHILRHFGTNLFVKSEYEGIA